MSGILVGVDGSGHSQRALEWAAKEAAIRQTSLTVLTVDQAVAGFWSGTLHYSGDETRTAKARDAAQAETDKVLATLGNSRPTSVTVKAAHGYPAEEIVKAASDADADMIVLGAHGEGGWSRQLIGATASKVFHHATVPVLIVPGERSR
jgi:nucleotide-binding universal stress UspA family protein